MSLSTAVIIIVIDIIAWAFFHYFISFLCFIIPIDYFGKDLSWSNIRSWEQNGEIWNKLFYVKRWKGRLIDGSAIVKQSYNKSNLHGKDRKSLLRFSAETKRAELTHWLLILPAPLFFLWNPAWAGWLMILYAVAANVPFIVTQRYNRGRIEKILKWIK